MDWVQITTTIVSAAGLLLAAATSWITLSRPLEKRYLQRAESLLSLHDAMAQRRLPKAERSKEHRKARKTLLNSMLLEAHANAALYVRSAGRLRRPGSYLVAIGLFAYAIIMASVSGSILSQGALPIIDAVVALVIAAGAVTLAAVAALQWRHRSITRQIRKQVGAFEEASVEGVKTMVLGARKLATRPSNSTDVAPNSTT